MIHINSRPLPPSEVVARLTKSWQLGFLLFLACSPIGFGEIQGQDSARVTDTNRLDPVFSSGPVLLEAVETALMDAIGNCEQSVVAITRVRKERAPTSQLDSLRFLPQLQLSNEPSSEDFIPTFFGSGIVVSGDGFIVTCAHVLDDPLKHSYYVWMDRRCYTASVVGKPAQVQASDPFTDLAVLKIDASGLKTMPRATDLPKKGQLVIALGNPYAIARDGQASASLGMISNVNRFAPKGRDQSGNESLHQLGSLIHTDLRSPVGTSGGALINWRGELVGMTTNFLAGSGYEQSAGLAIAVDEFFERVVEVLKQGKQPEFGFLGIQPENLRAIELDRGLVGARVSMVIPGLPGSRAGLREGDVISEVENVPVGNRNDLFRELSKVPTGTAARLTVQRLKAGNWQTLYIEAELTKKYLASDRPAFSLSGPTVWRGAQVEYGSAIAGELERISLGREGHDVALLNVAPESPVWRAGLRAGYGLISINGKLIHSPNQFHELAAKATGNVTLSAVTADGKKLTVVVESEAP